MKLVRSRGAASTRGAPLLQEAGGVAGVEDELAEADVADLVHLELERRHDAEVRPGAADAPEQVGVLVLAGAHQRPVGEDDVDRAEMVDGEPVLADQPADAAGGGQPADPHPAVVTGAERPAVRRSAAATSDQRAPAPIRTRRVDSSRTSIEFSLDRSMTMPPSLVDRPLMPCPPLRIASGTGCCRANASASTTSAVLRAWMTRPGEPPRM